MRPRARLVINVCLLRTIFPICIYLVLRGRYSWNMQVVIKRGYKQSIFQMWNLEAQITDMYIFFTQPIERNNLSPQSSPQSSPNLAALRSPSSHAGQWPCLSPRLLPLILITSFGFGIRTLCSWEDAPSTLGRLKLYFMESLPSIFFSFNKSYFNNKNIFILRIQFHNIFQASICSEISKTQTHASSFNGPDQLNSLCFSTLWFWLFCLLSIWGVRGWIAFSPNFICWNCNIFGDRAFKR